jgi:hypothetical protein
MSASDHPTSFPSHIHYSRLELSVIDPEIIVPALLSAAGIEPPADEVAALIAGYPAMRKSADMLYDVPGTIYESPAMTFHARV